MLKVCKKCGEEKLITEFSFKRPTGRKPGFQPRCKKCCVEDTRNWNIKNKASARDRYLQRTYNITEQEYKSRLLVQNNSCLLCKREFSNTWGATAPVVDHCHTHGHIRGILCNECNRGLGYFHDSIKTLENAILYLKDK
jgi:hypothetical protein